MVNYWNAALIVYWKTTGFYWSTLDFFTEIFQVPDA